MSMRNTDFQRTLSAQDLSAVRLSRWYDRVHVDPILVTLLTVVIVFGLVVLRSAVAGNEPLYEAQLKRLQSLCRADCRRGRRRTVSGWLPSLFVRVGIFGPRVIFGVQVKGSRWLDVSVFPFSTV